MREQIRNDPYLSWAIATDFAYVNLSQTRLLVECKVSVAALSVFLAAENDLSCLSLAPAYLHAAMRPAQNTFCSLDLVEDAGSAHAVRSILIELFDAVSARAAVFWSAVTRIELASAVAAVPRGVGVAPIPAAQNSPNLSKVQKISSPSGQTFLGLIDIGLPILREDWRARLVSVWDQSRIVPATEEERVVGFGYGREFAPALISGVTSASEAQRWYSQHEFPLSQRAFTHGAAVASVLASMRDEPVQAPLPMLAVQIPVPVLAHSARVALSAQILDAVVWMIVQAGLTEPSNALVVNVSLGTHAGPHDGSSILERALDMLIDLNTINGAERLAIAFAAGNTYEARCHADVSVTPTKPATLNWFVPPDGVSPNFMEVWFPPGAVNARVSLFAPDGREIKDVECGEDGALIDAAGHVQARMSLYAAGTSASGDDAMALLALAPSYASDTAGTWRIELAASSNIKGIHAYVERVNSMFDLAAPRGRQSRFVDTAYANATNRPGLVGDSTGSFIKRYGTLSSFSSGARTVVVGASIAKSRNALIIPEPARYASAGPRRGITTISQIARDYRPDCVAPGDAAHGQPGVRVLGTRTLFVTRMIGSSLAAPFVARQIARAMARSEIGAGVREWVQEAVAAPSGQYQTLPQPASNPRTGAGSFISYVLA